MSGRKYCVDAFGRAVRDGLFSVSDLQRMVMDGDQVSEFIRGARRSVAQDPATGLTIITYTKGGKVLVYDTVSLRSN